MRHGTRQHSSKLYSYITAVGKVPQVKPLLVEIHKNVRYIHIKGEAASIARDSTRDAFFKILLSSRSYQANEEESQELCSSRHFLESGPPCCLLSSRSPIMGGAQSFVEAYDGSLCTCITI